MTLDQLETFIAIAEQGGLRAASKVLNKTQPTLSTGMKNLEEELGVVLLNRESYRVKLTEEGKALLKEAKDILAHVEKFQLLSKEMRMGREPRLKLAIDYLCPVEFLLKVLSQFKKTCSTTKIEMDFEVLGGSIDNLINHDANIAITPFIGNHSSIEFQKICDIKIIPLAAKGLIKNNKPTHKELIKIPQITVKDSSKTPQNIDFAKNEDAEIWLVSDHMIKKELIMNGFGWGHLEESSVSKEIKKGKLLELKLKNVKTKKMPLYITRSTKKTFGPAAQDLWDYIINQFKEV